MKGGHAGADAHTTAARDDGGSPARSSLDDRPSVVGEWLEELGDDERTSPETPLARLWARASATAED